MKNFMKTKYELSFKAQVKFRQGKGKNFQGKGTKILAGHECSGPGRHCPGWNIYAPLPKGTAVTQLWKNVCMYVCVCCVCAHERDGVQGTLKRSGAEDNFLKIIIP